MLKIFQRAKLQLPDNRTFWKNQFRLKILQWAKLKHNTASLACYLQGIFRLNGRRPPLWSKSNATSLTRPLPSVQFLSLHFLFYYICSPFLALRLEENTSFKNICQFLGCFRSLYWNTSQQNHGYLRTLQRPNNQTTWLVLSILVDLISWTYTQTSLSI